MPSTTTMMMFCVRSPSDFCIEAEDAQDISSTAKLHTFRTGSHLLPELHFLKKYPASNASIPAKLSVSFRYTFIRFSFLVRHLP